MNSTLMLSAALGKGLWISYKLLLEAARGHTQKLLPMLRAMGNMGTASPITGPHPGN